ncbi:MAG TPA: hypothetical protein VHL14_08765 [Steroidobacteraceae bacterium]|nr:hypothetical protein [Steroidobacteraceae bacterium]
MAVVITIVVLLAVLFIWLVKHKPSAKRSKGGSALGWAILFLSSGRMPPPPPESQIEEEMQSKKNREASDKDK